MRDDGDGHPAGRVTGGTGCPREAERLALLSPEHVADPYPTYARLRAQAPVVPAPEANVWLVCTYEACLEVLGDPERFSSRQALSGQNRFREHPEAAAVLREGPGYPRVPTLILSDPPAHDRYRRIVQRAFAPARTVKRLTPVIEQTVDELIDAFAADGRCEFVGAFAYPLPMTVILTVLGVPPEMLETLKRWSDDFIAAQAGNVGAERIARAATSTVQWERYISGLLDERAADPALAEREDFLSRVLVEGSADAEDEPLTRPEQLSLAQQLLVGGNETTTNLLGHLMAALADDPALAGRLRSEPERVPRFVEEVLRHRSPLQGLYRVVTEDTEVQGVPLPAGARLMVLFASANRDETRYSDRFDPERTMREDPHLAFGQGAHACMGQSVARTEAVISVRRLLERLDDIRPTPAGRRENVELFGFHGLRSFDVSFHASGRR